MSPKSQCFSSLLADLGLTSKDPGPLDYRLSEQVHCPSIARVAFGLLSLAKKGPVLWPMFGLMLWFLVLGLVLLVSLITKQRKPFSSKVNTLVPGYIEHH